MNNFFKKLMGNKPKEHIQTPVVVRMRNYDDVFHRLMIALERLEMFLEIERLDGQKPALQQTAVMTSRDGHKDNNQPTDKELLLYELELQCSALYYQTKFDDEELYKSTTRYFLNDLLQWYGGRSEDIPYNVVDKYMLPILVVLSRTVDRFDQINATIKQYIGVAIEDNLQMKKEDVQSAFEAYIVALEQVHEQTHELLHSGEDVELTAHKRGDAIDGYKRVFQAFTHLYDVPTPAKVLIRTVSNFLPEVVEACPNLTEESVDEYYEKKVDGEEEEINGRASKEETNEKVIENK